jgi:hypothetical protein
MKRKYLLLAGLLLNSANITYGQIKTVKGRDQGDAAASTLSCPQPNSWTKAYCPPIPMKQGRADLISVKCTELRDLQGPNGRPAWVLETSCYCGADDSGQDTVNDPPSGACLSGKDTAEQGIKKNSAEKQSCLYIGERTTSIKKNNERIWYPSDMIFLDQAACRSKQPHREAKLGQTLNKWCDTICKKRFQTLKPVYDCLDCCDVNGGRADQKHCSP